MHDAGEPRSVYGNSREQGGLPFFLVLSLTVLGYGTTPSFYASRIQRSSLRLLATSPPRRSHILPFCTFVISAIARHAGSRYGVARRPSMVSNNPFISDEIGETAATCNVGDGGSGFECDFHYGNNGV